MRRITQQLMCELRAVGVRRNGKAPCVKSSSANGYYIAETLVDLLSEEQQTRLMAVPGVSVKNNLQLGCSVVSMY